VRWLVTGGAGYVGGHVVRALRAAGHDVAVLDDLSASDGSRVPAGVPLLRASVTDRDAVRRALAAFRADAVAHLAARKDAAESVRRPEAYRAVNVGGTRTVVAAMADLGVGRLVFASSAAVYGDPPPGPVGEDAPAKPANPYGESKAEGEDVLREAAGGGGLNAVVLRLFNVAGCGAPELAERGGGALLPGLLRPGCRPRVFGTDYLTRDGSCVRDYVHVLDVAAAFLAAAAHLDAAACGPDVPVFNVGSGVGHSVLEVVDAVRRVTGRSLEVEIADRRPGDPAEVVSDVTRIRAALDWRPQQTLTEMVRSQWEASRPSPT
jgi:UDP-glucose 4-epimerase